MLIDEITEIQLAVGNNLEKTLEKIRLKILERVNAKDSWEYVSVKVPSAFIYLKIRKWAEQEGLMVEKIEQPSSVFIIIYWGFKPNTFLECDVTVLSDGTYTR